MQSHLCSPNVCSLFLSSLFVDVADDVVVPGFNRCWCVPHQQQPKVQVEVHQHSVWQKFRRRIDWQSWVFVANAGLFAWHPSRHQRMIESQRAKNIGFWVEASFPRSAGKRWNSNKSAALLEVKWIQQLQCLVVGWCYLVPEKNMVEANPFVLLKITIRKIKNSRSFVFMTFCH